MQITRIPLFLILAISLYILGGIGRGDASSECINNTLGRYPAVGRNTCVDHRLGLNADAIRNTSTRRLRP